MRRDHCKYLLYYLNILKNIFCENVDINYLLSTFLFPNTYKKLSHNTEISLRLNWIKFKFEYNG